MTAKRNRDWLFTAPVQFNEVANFKKGITGVLPTPIQGNIVVVDQMSDFPAPVGGVITLVPDTQYWITGVGLTTTDRFVCNGNCIIKGLWTFGAVQISYTGGASMFTVNNGSFDIKDMWFDCPTGTFLTHNGTPAGLDSVLMNGIVLQSAAKVATLTNTFAVDLSDNAFLAINNGFEVLGTSTNIVSLRQVNMADLLSGAIGLDLNTTVVRTVELRDVVFGAVSGGPATGISGLASSGNILTGNVATVDSCEFDVANNVTPLVNITSDDIRWDFDKNSGVDNTVIRGLNTIENNSTVTPLTQNVPAPLEGTWTLQALSAQVETGPGGKSQLRYVGERPIIAVVGFSITLRANSGSPACRIYLYKNGSPLTGASVVIEPETGVDKIASLPWIDRMEQNDTYEIYAENLDNNNDIILLDGIMRILGDL